MTIDDIASLAKVSPATVSRVLNGKDNVASRTREKVFSVMDRLDYRLPASREQSHGMIGVVMPELDDPSSPEYIQCLSSALDHAGYGMLLQTRRTSAVNGTETVNRLMGSAVSGAIFVNEAHATASTDPGAYARLARSGVPICLINGYASDIPATALSMNMADAMAAAIAHLRMLGHSSIGLAVGPERFTRMARAKKYFLAAMRREDLDASAFISYSLATVDGGHAAVEELLGHGCTAVVCATPSMSLGAYLAAQDAGITIPEDLSLISIGDFALAPFLKPALTVIREPVAPMCEAAVTTILDRLGAGGAGRPTEFLFQGSLVVRGSTGVIPARREKTKSRTKKARR